MTDEPVSMRQAFGEALLELGERIPELVVLDADVSNSTQTVHFGKKFPDRFFNVGVAETNMVDMAAGMATCGLRPVVSTFALFLALKGVEQIRNTISYNQLPVILAGGCAGLSDSFDGASHQCITDIAIMRALPGMQVIVPFDPVQVKQSLEHALQVEGPVYIRLCRNPVPSLQHENKHFHFNQPNQLRSGNDITMVVSGIPAYMAFQAAGELEKAGPGTDLFAVTTLKPFNGKEIYSSLRKTGNLLTIEEHNRVGGLRSAILEKMPDGISIRSDQISIDDTYCESGPYMELMEKYGISTTRIIEKSSKLIAS
jgi:transketolase